MAAAIDYSDDYLYWDNVEALTIYLAQTAPDQTESTVTVADVPCQRVQNPGGAAPNYSGVDMETDPDTWKIPAPLLVDGADVVYPIRKGDRFTDGTTTWRVLTVSDRRVGSSLSHYVVSAIPER